MAQHIFTGSGAPASTPTDVGHHYIDTVSGVSYISVGTSSSADWKTSNQAVSSVFGRTGAVTAQSGDYTAVQVGADASGSATSAVASHVAALDPHPQYETAAEAQARVDAHEALTNNIHQVSLAQLIDVELDTPTTNQVLGYNGAAWVNQSANNTVNAGAGVSYFLSSTASGIGSYDLMSKTPDTAAETIESATVNNNTVLIDGYISNVTLNNTIIDAGVWDFNFYGYVDNNTHISTIVVEVYKRTSGGTETLLFTAESDEINETSVTLHNISSVQPQFACNATDKLLFKIYGKTTATTNILVSLVHSGSEHYSHVHTPLVLNHNDIAGLQGGSANEFYHLTSAEYTGTGTGNFVRASGATLSSPAITTPTGIVKGDVGLGNVDNTSDLNKPVSTAQQTALDLKADKTTTISAGTSLNGGGSLAADRTISHNNFGTAGTYGSASSVPVITTEATGHVSSVTPTAIAIASSAVTDFASAVIAQVLTGISFATSTAVLATDSILTAIGKLQAQVNLWAEELVTVALTNNSNVTLTNITELALTVVTGKRYRIEAMILFRSTATTAGITYTMAATGAAGTLAMKVSSNTGGDGTGNTFTGQITAFADTVTSTGVQATATDYILNAQGIFVCTTGGTITPQFRSEVNGQTITVGIGSNIIAREF